MGSQESQPKQRFPQIGIRLNAQDFGDLWLAAGRQRYRRTDGQTEPGRLFRALISVIWPLFQAARFEVRGLEELVSDISAAEDAEAPAKEWLYGLYRHLPIDSRRDIMRGVADTYRFRVPMPEAMNERDKDAIAEEGSKSQRPSSSQRGRR